VTAPKTPAGATGAVTGAPAGVLGCVFKTPWPLTNEPLAKPWVCAAGDDYVWYTTWREAWDAAVAGSAT
jgi:hypothetical protein